MAVRGKIVDWNAVQQRSREVETFLEIQRFRIRRPGESRDDEHVGISVMPDKNSPGQQWAYAEALYNSGAGQ